MGLWVIYEDNLVLHLVGWGWGKWVVHVQLTEQPYSLGLVTPVIMELNSEA